MPQNSYVAGTVTTTITVQALALTVGTAAQNVFTTANGFTGTLAGRALSYMGIYNLSTTATISIARGGVAVAGAAGTVTLLPGQFQIFTRPQAIPTNQVSIISSAASTPVTVEIG